MRKAVFFDRDGVVNDLVDRGENFVLAGRSVRHTAPWSLQELRIRPHIRRVMLELKQKGYLLIMATNQPDVNYGALSEENFQTIQREVLRLPFDDVRACRHSWDSDCLCRKPRPGMLLDAARQWGIHLESSYFVGDMESDLIAARAARCRGILIRHSYNTRVQHDSVVSSIQELPEVIA